MVFNIIIVIFGLCVFEIISSVDNAIVNAHILKTIPPKYQKIFLFWGLLFAVFIVRGLLPFIIVWMTNSNLSIVQIFTSVFSGSPAVAASMAASKPVLLLGGGIYLFLVFLSWLFLEDKKYAFLVEGFLHRQGAWFYAIVSILTTSIVYISLNYNSIMALAATVGTSAFFLSDGFKRNSEEQEKKIMSGGMSAMSKIIYLEVLDASFSVDGVIGAFAFTLSVPLIIIGNGLGALVVRELTVRGIKLISKFDYLKNGAMYSIGMLGLIMMLESFGHEYPLWMAPLNTFILLGFFLFLSIRSNKEKA